MNVRSSSVVIGVVLAGAIGGLFVGTRGTRVTADERRQTAIQRAQRGPHAQVPTPESAPPVPAAMAWRELSGTRRGPNALFVNEIRKLGPNMPAPEVREGRAERLLETLAARATRRAFDGAPPRIPHAFDERSTAACVVCHAAGAMVADRIAPRMSHATYQNCTQCHVATDMAAIERSGAPAENAFVGSMPHPGRRYLPGAPPVMPHPLAMRQTCLSCHGPLGPPGLRSTHPERANCTQCHVLEENARLAPTLGETRAFEASGRR